MHEKIFLICLIAVLALTSTALATEPDQERVGEEVAISLETPHPYWGPRSGEIELISTEEIYHSGASYIVPHFAAFALADGDYVVVRSPDGTRSWRYPQHGNPTSDFWAIRIPGDRAIIDLYSQNHLGGFGYTIDRYAHGDSAAETRRRIQEKAICGSDDTDWAPCYSATESTIYEESRAVLRLLINGTRKCTGWLVGSEGHVITNNHCIGSQSEASSTTYEIMAEGATCATDCDNDPMNCTGVVLATSATLVRTSVNLDYTLLKLPTNPTPTYGYLQLRQNSAMAGERIYIPQHPQFRGKRIAVESTDSHDMSGYAELEVSVPQVGFDFWLYYADTEEASSGAPVIAYSDHLVVALHRQTFFCDLNGNAGVDTPSIIADLADDLPNDSILYDLTVNLSGDGQGTVTSVPSGISCGLDCSESFGNNDVVILTASESAGSIFTGWSGGGCMGTGVCEVLMDSSKTVTAEFSSNECLVTVVKAGTGEGSVTSTPSGIDCGADCSEFYICDTPVMLKPLAAGGSVFSGWSGDCASGQVPTASDATCIATFTLETHELTLSKVGTGSCEVTSAPSGIDCGLDCVEIYDYGTVIALMASAGMDSYFAGWSGAPDCGDGNVTMIDDIACEAECVLLDDVIFVDNFESGDCFEWNTIVGGCS